MTLFDDLERKPRRLWTDEETESHCEKWAQNWVTQWNAGWGRIVNKIADRTNLSVDNVLFAMGYLQQDNSFRKSEEHRGRERLRNEEIMHDHRAWVKVNDRFEDVLIRIEKLLESAETRPV